MERIEARIVARGVLGLALTLVPALGPVPGPGALIGQEASQDTATAGVPAPPDAEVDGMRKR